MTCVWLFLAALVLRLGYLAIFRPSFDSLYWALATSILRDRSMVIDGTPITDFEPLYPLFLAVTRLLTGDDPLRSQILQVVMASAGTVYVYRLAMLLSDRSTVAAMTAALFAFHPLLVRQASIASDLSLATTLVAALGYYFASASSLRRMAGVGFLLGLVLLTRSMTLPLLALAPMILIMQRRLREATVLVVVAFLTFAPYMIRSRIIGGSWAPTRSGLNLYIGNSPYTAALLPTYDVDLLEEYADILIAQQKWSLDTDSVEYASAANQLLATHARDFISADPLRAARHTALKGVYFFWPFVIPYHVANADTRVVVNQNGEIVVHDAVRRPMIEVYSYSMFYLPVFAAAIAGVYIRRREWRRDAILWCIVATFVGVHAVYFPATRYRAPMAFVLLFYAAVAFQACRDSFCSKPSADTH